MHQYKIEDRWGSKITPSEEIKLNCRILSLKIFHVFNLNTCQSNVLAMYFKTHLFLLFHLFFSILDRLGRIFLKILNTSLSQFSQTHIHISRWQKIQIQQTQQKCQNSVPYIFKLQYFVAIGNRGISG